MKDDYGSPIRHRLLSPWGTHGAPPEEVLTPENLTQTFQLHSYTPTTEKPQISEATSYHPLNCELHW